jgi:acetolactate synthase-1/3 small subunit|tara:strand:+ start:1208 stop:1699 length:492 start_codon:yes stop_codon:yes gene_type:complete
MEENHILIAMVEDRPGVLQRIAGLFRKRNFNIDSITVGHSEKPGISRITLTVTGDLVILEQVMKQLNKIVEVLKVIELYKDNSVLRELALIKIKIENEANRSEIVSYINIFRGRIIDVSNNLITVEITGDSSKVEAFINIVGSDKIKELARTGITAMGRGSSK